MPGMGLFSADTPLSRHRDPLVVTLATFDAAVAIRKNEPDELKRLLRSGDVDVNGRVPRANGRLPHKTREMIAAGIVAVSGPSSETLIEVAIRTKRMPALTALLENRADPGGGVFTGLETDYPTATLVLLDWGADPNARKGGDGPSLLEVVCASPLTKKNLDIAHKLLDKDVSMEVDVARSWFPGRALVILAIQAVALDPRLLRRLGERGVTPASVADRATWVDMLARCEFGNPLRTLLPPEACGHSSRAYPSMAKVVEAIDIPGVTFQEILYGATRVVGDECLDVGASASALQGTPDIPSRRRRAAHPTTRLADPNRPNDEDGLAPLQMLARRAAMHQPGGEPVGGPVGAIVSGAIVCFARVLVRHGARVADGRALVSMLTTLSERPEWHMSSSCGAYFTYLVDELGPDVRVPAALTTACLVAMRTSGCLVEVVRRLLRLGACVDDGTARWLDERWPLVLVAPWRDEWRATRARTVLDAGCALGRFLGCLPDVTTTILKTAVHCN